MIHEKGVMPDIVVEEGKIEVALTAEKKPEDVFEEIEKKEKPAKEAEQPNYKSDNQIMRAVDVLKAVKFYKGARASEK